MIRLSGQTIASGAGFGFSSDSLNHLANEVISARDTGVQVAVVVGDGSVSRGILAALGQSDVRLMTAPPINNLTDSTT